MTQGDLANAPLIDTDLPTSDVYLNQQISYYQSGQVAGAPAGQDMNRKFFYGNTTTAMISMDNVPNSFGIDASQKGIAGIYLSRDYKGGTTLRMAIHQPIPDVKGFITNWDLIPGVEQYVGAGDPNTSFRGAGSVAAQRQGQYVYAFMWYHRVGLFTTTNEVTVYKVTRDEYVQVVGVSGGDQQLSGASSTTPTSPIIQAQNGGQFFVSDEEEPFIWNVSGSISFGGTATMTGFRDDNSGDIGYYYTIYNNGTGQTDYYYHGQSSAFMQQIALPEGTYGYGPYLVQPWVSGNYNPPELWFFITEFDESGFNTTGRFRIYRSRWKKGAYTKPANMNLADDPDFENGKIPFPTLNPRGYGWETNIWDDTHLVGIIGPFDMNVYNPKDHVLATMQNSQVTNGQPIGSKSGLPFGFKVVRDHKRYGTLHVVALDGGVYPEGGSSLNRVWFANSADDGATWSRMTQINPTIAPATQGTPYSVGNNSSSVSRTNIPQASGLQAAETVSYSNYNGGPSPSVVRTHDDVLLMGNLSRYTDYTFADGTHPPYGSEPPNTGSRVALAVIDYTGRGVGSYNKNTVIFAQRASRGQIAWQ